MFNKMNCTTYNICSLCTESEHIQVYHKNLKYLTYLVNNSGLTAEQEDLHRHLVKKINGSLLYTPLRKKEVEKEFLQHLKVINDVVNK